MNTNNTLYRKTVTKIFKVSSEKANEHKVLSICSMLDAVTNINDEVIVELLGNLDFGRVSIDHFSLDVINNAQLNDVVTMNSYVEIISDQRIKVMLKAHKSIGGREIILLIGAFAFSIEGIELLHYSLS
jgi:hypothetical protein